MTGAMSLEILSSLASVRDDVERQVAKLDRYRALKAIEQTIVDFPALEDLNRTLGDLRDSMQRQLNETREVRALQKIEKIMPDLSDVLALLTENARLADPEGSDAAPVADDFGRQAPAGAEGAPEAKVSVVEIVETRVLESAETNFAPVGGEREPSSKNADGRSFAENPGQVRDADTDPPSSEPGGSLAYSLAQLMVQAMVPPGAPPANPAEAESAGAESKPETPVSNAAVQSAERAA